MKAIVSMTEEAMIAIWTRKGAGSSCHGICLAILMALFGEGGFGIWTVKEVNAEFTNATTRVNGDGEEVVTMVAELGIISPPETHLFVSVLPLPQSFLFSANW